MHMIQLTLQYNITPMQYVLHMYHSSHWEQEWKLVESVGLDAA